jgi:glutamate-5-semialdehyde dehydrogenase
MFYKIIYVMSTITTIIPQLEAAKKAARAINRLDDDIRKKLAAGIANTLRTNIPGILEANEADLAAMDKADPLYDRLQLTAGRIEAIAGATDLVSTLADPAGKLVSTTLHPNGMLIEKITVPLGVVGAIYEARPNVTVDISVLCVRSGNAVVLKGGSDAQYTNLFLVKLMQEVLFENGLPIEAITLLPPQREAVGELLTATRFVDVIIPRGSQGLIDFVRKNATVPTIETGAGVCHTYVHEKADLQKAAAIVVNAKTQRPSVCNALDTVLVDEKVAAAFLPLLIPGFLPFNEGVFADEKAFAILAENGYANLHHANTDDFGREYLSQNCSVKTVSGLTEALEHIAAYSSRHSEAIITEDAAVAETFLSEVDAAAVYHNASTRFTDGGEFGLGAELGISTQKLHARGPFALEKLVCEKWVVRGNGQVR